MQPRIYTYKITFIDTPYYYYGVHKEKRFNEEYWGSPITHKWCWDFYEPKKQILQLFDYTDEGWIRAQEVEKRLIKPIYNKDKYCLNENVGGITSTYIRKLNGKKTYELGVGVHSRTKEQMKEHGKKIYELGLGVSTVSKEQLRENIKKVNSQKWKCLITGYISNPGGLTSYQRARGIDTTKRIKLSLEDSF